MNLHQRKSCFHVPSSTPHKTQVGLSRISIFMRLSFENILTSDRCHLKTFERRNQIPNFWGCSTYFTTTVQHLKNRLHEKPLQNPAPDDGVPWPWHLIITNGIVQDISEMSLWLNIFHSTYYIGCNTRIGFPLHIASCFIPINQSYSLRQIDAPEKCIILKLYLLALKNLNWHCIIIVVSFFFLLFVTKSQRDHLSAV